MNNVIVMKGKPRMILQHFPLSSAPAHCFFPGLKPHKAVRTAH